MKRIYEIWWYDILIPLRWHYLVRGVFYILIRSARSLFPPHHSRARSARMTCGGYVPAITACGQCRKLRLSIFSSSYQAKADWDSTESQLSGSRLVGHLTVGHLPLRADSIDSIDSTDSTVSDKTIWMYDTYCCRWGSVYTWARSRSRQRSKPNWVRSCCFAIILIIHGVGKM